MTSGRFRRGMVHFSGQVTNFSGTIFANKSKAKATRAKQGLGAVGYPQKSLSKPSPKPLARSSAAGIIGFRMTTTSQPNMFQDNLPQICSEVGLSCQECTAGTARQVASLCKGLRGKAIGQLFVQIYPNPACAPMHAHFAEAYQEASAEVRMIESPATAAKSAPEAACTRREVAASDMGRRGVASQGGARLRAMVAVA